MPLMPYYLPNEGPLTNAVDLEVIRLGTNVPSQASETRGEF